LKFWFKMEGDRGVYVKVFYLLAIAIFPLFLVYLFFVKNSADFSIASIIFVGFLGILCLVLIYSLFSSRGRDFLGLAS